jgi:hypothetical protein
MTEARSREHCGIRCAIFGIIAASDFHEVAAGSGGLRLGFVH